MARPQRKNARRTSVRGHFSSRYHLRLGTAHMLCRAPVQSLRPLEIGGRPCHPPTLPTTCSSAISDIAIGDPSQLGPIARRSPLRHRVGNSSFLAGQAGWQCRQWQQTPISSLPTIKISARAFNSPSCATSLRVRRTCRGITRQHLLPGAVLLKGPEPAQPHGKPAGIPLGDLACWHRIPRLTPALSR